MLRRNELRVKPVKRYGVPQYPSHEDPDPTLHPQPIPYPASKKLLAAVATMGIMASSACNRSASPGNANANSAAAAIEDEAVSGEDVGLKTEDIEEMEELWEEIDVAQEALTFVAAQSQQDKDQLASAAHPFDLKLSGLPHRTSPYGTGVPNYIDEEIARELIAKVFNAES